MGDSEHNRFSGMDIQTFRKIIKKHQDSSDAILRLYKEACKNRIPFPNKVLEVKHWSGESTASKMIEYMNKNLDKRPIGITYEHNLIGNPTSTRPANHTSSIVGRRWNPLSSKCDYLVRDSIGEVNITTHYAGLPFEKGYFWMTEEILTKKVAYTDKFNP